MQPFSALDVLTAENLRSEVLRLWQSGEVPTTCILIITHGIEEAIQLADRLVILERDPGRVRTVLPVNLPHPRDSKSQAFQNLADLVYTTLTAEEKPHFTAPTAPLSDSVYTSSPSLRGETTPVISGDFSSPLATGSQFSDPLLGFDFDSERYPLLPAVRIASVAGLLAFLTEGSVDLYSLGQRLQLDVDDLYPIIEAGEILGLLEVDGSVCTINDKGQQFMTSSIDDRKALVREAISNPETSSPGSRLIREIHHLLCQAGPRARIPQELIFDTILLKNFSPQESRRQLEIAIEWGRFAELYGYESPTGSLFLDADDNQNAEGSDEGKDGKVV